MCSCEWKALLKEKGVVRRNISSSLPFTKNIKQSDCLKAFCNSPQNVTNFVKRKRPSFNETECLPAVPPVAVSF